MVLGAGLFLSVICIWVLVEQQSKQPTLAALGLFGGIILVAFGTLRLRREHRYFDPRNDYWIEIGPDDFALVTPDVTDRRQWVSLTPFEVKTIEHRNKYGWVTSKTFETAAFTDGVEINVPLKDFATRIGGDQQDRATAMCLILDEFRTKALNPSEAADYQVPAGIVIAPMPAPKPKPFDVTKSVVQRQ